MIENKLERFSIANIRNNDDTDNLNHFILSDSDTLMQKFSLNESFVFDGIVLGLCLKGSVTLKTNFREYKMEANTVLVLFPNQIVTVYDKSDDYYAIFLFITIDFIADIKLKMNFDILSNIENFPCLKVSSEVMEDLVEYHNLIIKQYDQFEQVNRLEIVKSLLIAIFMKLTGIYSFQKELHHIPSSREEEITNDFFKLLGIYYKQERSVVFYADKLCITPKYLSSIIKKITKESVLYWIHILLITESKTLLKSTNLNIKQICDDLNFSNSSFFSKFFKEHTGMTPTEYRERNEML